MGSYRLLRLAYSASNGCLYRLREIMRRARSPAENSKKKHHSAAPPPPISSLSAPAITRSDGRKISSRKSYYITRELVHEDSPRKSSKQRHKRTKSPNRYAAPPSSCSPEAEFRADSVLSTTNHERVSTKSHPFDKSGEFPELELRPIITKSGSTVGELSDEPKKTRSVWVNRVKKEEKSSSSVINPRRRSVSSSVSFSPGVKLRVNSPKVGRRMMMQRSWRRSTAVVKSSVDPKKDFRESMVEMIKANNIRGSKDLEDLLACYLCLNSEEYHDLIINVFKQIWFDLNTLPARPLN